MIIGKKCGMDLQGPLDLRIEAFSSILVYGQSNSGKSFLSAKVAVQRDNIFNKKHSKCIIFYQHLQDCFLNAKELDRSIVLVSNREDLEKELEPKTLLICDDYLLASFNTENNLFITKFFLERCHHDFISLFMQTQLLFSKAGRAWTLNASHFVFFRSLNESNMLRYFKNFGSESDFMFKCYKKALTGRPYGHFLLVFTVKQMIDYDIVQILYHQMV